MAIGIETPIGGGIIFGVVKFIGYTGYASALKKLYQAPKSNAYLFAISRTLIGLVVGFAYYKGFELFHTGDNVDALYYCGLAPLRLIEWYLIIWFFFDRDFKSPKQIFNCALGGAVLSYFLDIPAVFGFIQVSGFWIC